MDRVRDLVTAGGVTVVLAQDRDRFIREPSYHYLLKKDFREQGCELRALNDRGDDSPEGELTDGILDQLAKYERAKVAERTRRGKRKKVQQGRILATHSADYGFQFNARRDGYQIDEEKMAVVRRIFRWVGVDGWSVRRVRRTLDDLGVEPPGGLMNKSGMWNETQLRTFIRSDVYKAHSYEELEMLVAPGVAANLDSNKRYGIWWWGRKRHKSRQVSEQGLTGKVYKKATKAVAVPREEWVAVPVPDSGIPRQWVDTAREALNKNKRPSFNSRRFWELSGGIMRCACCGWAMSTTAVGAKGLYYRCRRRVAYGKDVCDMKKHLRADSLEPLVWGSVSEVLKEPERLKAGLNKVLEEQRDNGQGESEAEIQAWREKLSEVERKRSRFQDMAADNLMTREELRSKLEGLEQKRGAIEHELALAIGRSGRLDALERGAEALLEAYASVCVEELDDLSPEERHELYRMLGLTVEAHPDGKLDATWRLRTDLSNFRARSRPLYGRCP